jgi:hypothetical protein
MIRRFDSPLRLQYRFTAITYGDNINVSDVRSTVIGVNREHNTHV